MTENEAIERMKYRIETATDIAGKGVDGKAYEDMEIAIKALSEIQQYRSIGTVEEIQQKIEELQNWHDEHLEDIAVDLPEYRELCNLDEISHMKSLKRIIKRNGTIGKALDECAEYEEIGTVSECREAVEKQRAKKPFEDICCPNCGWIVFPDAPKDIRLLHCENCGQAISWEED